MSTPLDPAQDRYFEPGAPDPQPKVILIQAPQPVSSGQHHGNVNHVMPSPSVKQGRDKAVYTRQQKGHSLLAHLLFGIVVLWIPAMYITASPNHYWHL